MAAGPFRLCGRIRLPVQGPPSSSADILTFASPKKVLRRGLAGRAPEAVDEAAQRLAQPVILDRREQAADLGVRLGRGRRGARQARRRRRRYRTLVDLQAPDRAIAEVAVDALQHLRLEMLQLERERAGDAHVERALA